LYFLTCDYYIPNLKKVKFLNACNKKALYYNGIVGARSKKLLIEHKVHCSREQLINLIYFMNKQAIVEAVNGILNTTKVQAEQVVDKVFDSIVASLKKGEEVSVAGLGIFSVKQRAARDARNPRTGETVKVPAMKVPKFRAAKALKDAVK
jgi:DNA-binding protein HU-beta